MSCVGSGLCDELITRLEECYHLYVCLIVCDLETSIVKCPRPDMGLWRHRKQQRFCSEIAVRVAVSPFDLIRLLPAVVKVVIK